MKKDYKSISDDELIAYKRDVEAKLDGLKQELRAIAKEQEIRLAKAKFGSMSPTEKEALRQVVSAEAIKSKSKVYDM